ncbi:MAG: acyl-CoA/acyl-ACP dehydrogenase [Sphingomonadaceae bacterium]|nr:acyl-CoA/acyl-ACP dehydrogenase [Sphingomonadaceae bacterium]
MDLGLSEEQTALQDSLRSMLADRFPTAALRRCESDPAQASAIYSDLQQMGIGAILIAEGHGGLGMAMADLVVAQSELGRALVPLLFTESSVMAATLLELAGGAKAGELLTQISAGEILVSCAVPAESQIIASGAGETAPTLSGEAQLVTEPALAGYLLVDAIDEHGQRLTCLLPCNAAGVTISEQPNLADLSLATVTFANAPVEQVIARGEAADIAWATAQDRMKIAIAAQAVGGAEHILEIARDYARTREQFGQPIGSFQAIAHMLADALVNLEGARILTFRAAAAMDEGEDCSTWARMAKMKAAQTFRDISAMAIQIHGGIGFTLEADPQLFYRRAKHLQLAYGEPLDLQEQVGAALFDGKHRVLEA